MAKKPTIASISSGYQGTATLNDDLQALRNAFDNTLSLDGSTPNAMEADFDLNSNDILNGGTINASQIVVAGINLTAQVALAEDAADDAIAAASLAGASETAAAGYASAADVSASEAALSASEALSSSEASINLVENLVVTVTTLAPGEDATATFTEETTTLALGIPAGADGIDGTDGTNGTNGTDGVDGTDGLGWTGGSYTAGTGVVTFTSDDGLGFATGDLRGADGTDGIDGTNGTDGLDGTNGTDGLGWTSGSYNAGTGVVTFASDDGLGFVTGDLRGADGVDGADGADGTNGTDGADGLGWTGGSYNAGTGIVTFTSDDGLGFSTGDLRGADGTGTGDALVGSTNTFTASQIIQVTDNTNAALRVTQLGTGDAIRVEDSATPDSTSFRVDSAGTVIAGGNITSGNNLIAAGTSSVIWTSRGILSSPAAGGIQLGSVDAAAPVAQTLSAQSVVAGTTNTAGQALTIRGSRGTGTGAGGAIALQTAPAGTTGTAQNAAVERMRIDSAGNVGIGTASPADKLHVEGNVYLGTTGRTIYTGGSANLTLQTNTGSTIFLRSNGSSESMRLDASGNVSIGTNSTSSRLEVYGGAANSITALGTEDAATVTITNSDVGGIGRLTKTLYQVGNLSLAAIGAVYTDFNAGGDIGGALVFGTQTNLAGGVVERLRINKSGSLGLGGSNFGTSGQFMKSAGSAASPAWATIANTDISGLGTLATQSGTFSGTSSGTNTGDQSLFSTIAVSGQSDVVADTTSDTLTLVAGTNITITTDSGTDSITIASTGGTSSGALLRAPQILTSGTSYTSPAGCNTIYIELVGGGGGSGGINSGADNVDSGTGGGGAGAYAAKYFTVTPSTSYTYAIGAGGTAGTSSPTNGGTGGSTTFTVGATTVTAAGGSGSTGMSNTASATAGGAGGAATNGDINITGTGGASGSGFSDGGVGGSGGNSFFGGGAAGTVRITNGVTAGIAGTSGGGASGAAIETSTSAESGAGAAGGAGLIRVWEYS